MARVYWVTCPDCKGRFCCHYDELRHNKEYKLHCPYCQRQFFNDESPKIED